ncbi:MULTISPECIES: hypothetical protein [Streptomyces]|uniref:hypothetical protein n=1 Tax=Streptomyces TaxID=1883 RepID=UPI000F7B5FA0|nr:MULTISPECIES: hypothetical protein [Streptomyces]RST05851.1 hypothetical protein EF910_11880 [Streptomyces sp. WAC07149]GLX21273.1 hypothetical protein Slala01_49170 [Streptomyces lavendulae subsp. lavendulae]GLX27792.1 hypothetical protein Slala02_36120 [Streptomyces lavendulae subsp. lavendulae]
MSRTAHHTPDRRTPYGRQSRHGTGHRGPWRRVDMRTLRYSAAELRAAEGAGRRPRPQEVRRAFDSWRYCCAFAGSLSEAANLEERTARARLRAVARKALFDPETVIEPYRTRYQAHWHSW